jgi:transposase
MVDLEFIRKKHLVDGWSVRRISRQLGLARQTVRKALRVTELPHYEREHAPPRPVVGPFEPVIERWLAADRTAPKKQRHTAKRIYDRLVAEYGFTGHEATIRRTVARLRPKTPEVFVPLTVAWGEQAQVDWGQATVRIAGQPVVAHLFCLRLRASQVPFVWAAPTEKLEAFLAGHVRAFEWLGGVPATCLYDNPKTAVVRILAGPHRQEHEVFSSLRTHYLFESVFCRPAQGHEKGAVENLVGYARRNTLVPVPEVASWDELNAHLLAWCEQERRRLADRWALEAPVLRPLPPVAFRPALARLLPVSPSSLVRIDHNRYSVPGRYVGRTLLARVFTERVEVWDGDTLVAEHRRRYGRGETAMRIEHYLPVIARKPRAATHAAVVEQMPPIYGRVRDRLCGAHIEGYRDFAAILLLHLEFPAEAVHAALEEASDRDCLSPSAVRQLVINRTAPPTPDPILLPPDLAAASVEVPNLASYDALLVGAGR